MSLTQKGFFVFKDSFLSSFIDPMMLRFVDDVNSEVVARIFNIALLPYYGLWIGDDVEEREKISSFNIGSMWY